MPSWSVHLKIGKELNKELKLDKDKFLFGSLIPDTDSNWKLGRYKAHYYGSLKFPKCPRENMIDIDSFLYDYSDKLDDPLIIGYYVHLLTDNYYNEYIYYNKWVQDQNHNIIGIRNKDGDIIDNKIGICNAMGYKHSDLELYGKKLFNNEELDIPNNIGKISLSIPLLKDNFITIENVIYRINYLNSEFIKFNELNDEDYKLFTQEELDELLNNCINYIKEELSKVGIIDKGKNTRR